MRRCSRLVRIGSVGLLALAGCGGTEAANGEDASASDATFGGLVSGPDASPTLLVPDGGTGDVSEGCGPASASRDAGSLCPVAAPPVGATCTTEGAQCEYGSSWDVQCDLLAVCTAGEAGLTWQLAIDGCQCPGVLDAGSCASDGGLSSAGCSAVGASCVSGGGGCECVLCYSAVPDSPPSQTWVCAGSTAGCPAERPRFGDPCAAGAPAGGATSCSYPSGCSGWSMDCSDAGYWQGRHWPPRP